MPREMVMASTMVDSPGLVSTMSAAARAASVAPCTAMPMSARFSAGASFTPSPVMPTAKPARRSASTIRNLCSGNTCAKPSAPMIVSVYFSRSFGGLPLASRLGSVPASRMSVPSPSWRAVSFAIARWSPVTIFTSTPYAMARSSVTFVSGRGGSRNVSSPSSCQAPPGPAHGALRATASERMPRVASASTASCSGAREGSSAGSSAAMMCGAPLVVLNTSPLRVSRTVPSVRFTAGSNGM